MIKKLLKYGKILMALTLISALALPSYATVGAADGSAFVTKAEFDAALSDFNARLTTFEAGINSKIDSQVSSYLDRNGIWNGRECKFHDDSNNPINFPFTFKTYFNKGSLSSSNFNAGAPKKGWKANKSGLLNLTLYQTQYESTALTYKSKVSGSAMDTNYHSMLYAYICFSKSSATLTASTLKDCSVVFALQIPGNEFYGALSAEQTSMFVGAFAGRFETFAFVEKDVDYYISECLSAWTTCSCAYNLSYLYVSGAKIY